MTEPKYPIPTLPVEENKEFYEALGDIGTGEKKEEAPDVDMDIYNPQKFKELVSAMEQRSVKAKEDIETAKDILRKKIDKYESILNEFYRILSKGRILYKGIAREVNLYNELFDKFERVSVAYKHENGTEKKSK